MKVLYLAVRKEPLITGVDKKILATIDIWKELGVDVLACFCTARGSELSKAGTKRNDISLVEFEKYNPLKQYLQARAFIQWVNGQGIDLIYFRYKIFPIGFSKLFANFPTVVEVNSDDRAETKLIRSWNPVQSSIMNEFTRRRVFSRADGIVSVSSELMERSQFLEYRLPAIVIGNGASLNEIPSVPPAKNDRVRLLFTGSGGQPWHGVEKIKEAALSIPEFDFVMIGDLEKGESVSKNMRYTGRLSGESLLQAVSMCDVGIGTLALHKNGMNEASPLKVRDYLAWGLPIIIGYNDTDFPEDVEFILKLPNNERNVVDSIDEIRTFCKRWKGKRVPREKVVRIDAVDKEKKRLAFFEKIGENMAAGKWE